MVLELVNGPLRVADSRAGTDGHSTDLKRMHGCGCVRGIWINGLCHRLADRNGCPLWEGKSKIEPLSTQRAQRFFCFSWRTSRPSRLMNLRMRAGIWSTGFVADSRTGTDVRFGFLFLKWCPGFIPLLHFLLNSSAGQHPGRGWRRCDRPAIAAAEPSQWGTASMAFQGPKEHDLPFL